MLAASLYFVACHPPATPVVPAPTPCADGRIGKVSIEGGSAIDVPQLAVLEGTLDDPARTDRIAKVSTDLLRARGYAHANIVVTRQAGCGVELAVAVDKGPHFRIAHIGFITDDDFSEEVRVASIEDALGTVNSIGGAYVEDRLHRALEALRLRYIDAGWLDVEIEKPLEVYDEPRGEIVIAIPIRAGQRFKIGNVVARGGRRSTRAAVIESLGLRGGDWYDGAAVRRAVSRARRELAEHIDLRVQVATDHKSIDLEAIVGARR
ncbi:MAG: hypothetical protein HOV81_06390 [Kofleriaceae bacterium]|nr:hypothetical protein [Kofleriaceae bacterium]